MKALEVLKTINRRYCTDNVCGKLDLAIKELEELNNRSCKSCKHISRPFKDNAKGCNILNIWLSNDFYCSKHEAKSLNELV